VRDARPQGAQERGAGPNRNLAGRSGAGIGNFDVAFAADSFWRLAGAIALDALALAVWNVGTRAPLAVLREALRAARDARRLLAGTLTLLVGLIFVAAGAVLLLPAVDDPADDFLPVEIFTFIIALALEYLIGGDIRALATGKRR
jgi:hypothetical protein